MRADWLNLVRARAAFFNHSSCHQGRGEGEEGSEVGGGGRWGSGGGVGERRNYDRGRQAAGRDNKSGGMA